MNMKTAHIVCVGCYEARMECAQLQRFLEMNGFQIEIDPKQADLTIMYACGLTELDGQISLDILKDLENRKKPNADLLVWGCLPKIDPKLVAKTHNGPTFGRREIHKLEEMIQAKVKYDEVTANHLFPESEDVQRLKAKHKPDDLTHLIEEVNYRIRSKVASVTEPEIFHIMVARGCLGHCAYCSDLHSCGRAGSKRVERVVAEFKRGLEQGFKRFHLMATDLGAYGRDLGYNLSHLLKKLTSEKGDYRLLLPNVNPSFLKEMLEDDLAVFRSGRISLLGAPVESGSNRILEAMGRKYTIEEFSKCIAAVNEEFPEILVWTQLMVGFPGETEDDFEATLRLLDEVSFDYIQVFRFSARPTTPASFFKDQVSQTVSLNRYQRLLAKAIHKELTRMTHRTSYQMTPSSVKDLTDTATHKSETQVSLSGF